MMKVDTHKRAIVNSLDQLSPVLFVDEDLMTVEDVARFLKVPESWVYERIRRRGIDRLPHFKIGKYLRLSEREIAIWLKEIRGI